MAMQVRHVHVRQQQMKRTTKQQHYGAAYTLYTVSGMPRNAQPSSAGWKSGSGQRKRSSLTVIT